MSTAVGHHAKLKNRRVFLGKDPELPGEFLVQFKYLVDAEIRAERVQITRLRLTESAMHELACMYLQHHIKL